MNKASKSFEFLSDIFIFIIILIFPLAVGKTGFFSILEFKWYTYLIVSTLYIVSNVIIYLYFLIYKKINYLKEIKLSKIQVVAIIFLLINIISCFTSPFFKNYNLFIGVGRGEGLIMMSLYVITFLLLSIFAKFKPKYILYFSVSSILLNSISILQYIGFNPLNMYQNGIGTHNVSFMTTIGNIDFISALYTILITISMCSFIFLNENIKNKIIHLISILMGFFIIGIINVSSGKVAFLAILVLIFPFIISNNKKLSRFIVVIATVLLSYCINLIINPEYHYDIHQLVFNFNFNYIVITLLIVIGVLTYLAHVLSKVDYDYSDNKKIIKYFYLLVLASILLVTIVIYFYDFKSGILYEVHELLHFNFSDDFGTYRIFLWKRAIPLATNYPLLGTGPDTFAISFMARYINDIGNIGPLTLNDTAANVYITMLINIGFIGLISYLTFLILNIKQGIKRMNKYSNILLVAIICFIIQDFFNLSVVIVSPIFWTLLALHYKSLDFTIDKS